VLALSSSALGARRRVSFGDLDVQLSDNFFDSFLANRFGSPDYLGQLDDSRRNQDDVFDRASTPRDTVAFAVAQTSGTKKRPGSDQAHTASAKAPDDLPRTLASRPT